MLVVVCHDAGGAEVVSSHVRRAGSACLFVLEGPARRIFERKLGAVKSQPLENAIAQASSLLCGTSWSSTLELEAIAAARSAGRPSVAFLDHWTSYRERFIRSGTTCLPDEMWVGDGMAESLARQAFPGVPITVVDNPYFADIRDEFARHAPRPSPGARGLSVLYVCEPLAEHARVQHGDRRFWGYVEEEALRYFLGNIGALDSAIERIVIRPHPAEAADKYAWAPGEFSLPIVFGGSRPLIDEIADCDVVVGCESMAMVVGLLNGRRVITSVPPGGKPCSLPHPHITSLQALVIGSAAG